MGQTVCPLLGVDERVQLTAIVGDRNRPQKHVQRVNIILLSAAKLPVLEVARRTGASRPAVWRWQQRFAEEGVDGLLRDKTRKPGKAPLSTTRIAQVLALPCGEPPPAGHPSLHPRPQPILKALHLDQTRRYPSSSKSAASLYLLYEPVH